MKAISRARLALEGLSVGDAFGEQLLHAGYARGAALATRVAPVRGPWRWTDDTAMALSVVDVLAHHGGIDARALAQAFARHYVREPARGYGRVVAVMSTSVYEPIAGLGVSNSTRAAVAGYLKTLADELPAGVTANGVLPGYTDTERLDALAGARAAAAGSDAAAVRAAWAQSVPEGRLGRPDETAAAIVFLCGPSAGYIRGVFLPVDGGRLRSI